jgi:hypothetical protein
MAYSKEAHELLNEAFEVLQTKTNHPYPFMVGMLMPNVNLTDAKRIAKVILEMESDK